MSKRSDIIDGNRAVTEKYGLVYTELLGWIDLGHAQGNDIRHLFSQISQGEASGEEYYTIRYSQGMTGLLRQIRVGSVLTWQIRSGRDYFERQRIALAMMMAVTHQFESFQASFPNKLVTDSGFSGEDLVSNLLGFYRVISNYDPLLMLRPVSKEDALARWDYYGKIGNWKNKKFQPLLFPDPKKSIHRQPFLGELPEFMKRVVPYNNFFSDDVIRSGENDKKFMVLGAGSNRMGL